MREKALLQVQWLVEDMVHINPHPQCHSLCGSTAIICLVCQKDKTLTKLKRCLLSLLQQQECVHLTTCLT